MSYPQSYKHIYSRLPITRTLSNLNLALTRTKIDFPWIPVIHLLQCYPRQLEPSITRTFRQLEAIFVSLRVIFYIILPSITRTTLNSGLKVYFGFGSICATRCKFLGAQLKNLGAQLKILGASKRKSEKFRAFDVVVVRWFGGYSVLFLAVKEEKAAASTL